MKIIDKFLKFLKTDRNTFFTYILTVLATYLLLVKLTIRRFKETETKLIINITIKKLSVFPKKKRLKIELI